MYIYKTKNLEKRKAHYNAKKSQQKGGNEKNRKNRLLLVKIVRFDAKVDEEIALGAKRLQIAAEVLDTDARDRVQRFDVFARDEAPRAREDVELDTVDLKNQFGFGELLYRVRLFDVELYAVVLEK